MTNVLKFQLPEFEVWEEELSISDEDISFKRGGENLEDFWIEPEEELDFERGNSGQ